MLVSEGTSLPGCVFRLLWLMLLFGIVPLFKCCPFAYMLFRCFCFSMIVDFQIFKATRSPIHIYRYPISAAPSPSSSLVLLRPNRCRWMACIPLPFPLVLIAGFAAGGKLEQGVNPSGSPILGLIPTHIALAPPDVDLSGGPSWQKRGYCPVLKGTQGQSHHDQLPLTSWAKQDYNRRNEVRVR